MKKMLQRSFVVVLSLLLVVFGTVGCGASAKGVAEDAAEYEMMTDSTADAIVGGMNYSANRGDGALKMEAAEVEEGAPTSTLGQPIDRKLIRNVRVEMETKTFDLMMSQIEENVKARDGYIENMDTYNGSAYYGHQNSRYANLTIRIPADKLDAFLQEVSTIGNVISRSEDVEDVTLSYVDTQSRRDMLRIEQERLMAILEKSDKVEDIIAVEERLSEVRYQLESMESQLRTLDNQVDYATVRLSISEVREFAPVAEQTVGERIKEGFAGTLHDIADDVEDLYIWFVVNIPYFVMWAIGIGIVIALIVARKKRKAKKNKQVE